MPFQPVLLILEPTAAEPMLDLDLLPHQLVSSEFLAAMGVLIPTPVMSTPPGLLLFVWSLTTPWNIDLCVVSEQGVQGGILEAVYRPAALRVKCTGFWVMWLRARARMSLSRIRRARSK